MRWQVCNVEVRMPAPPVFVWWSVVALLYWRCLVLTGDGPVFWLLVLLAPVVGVAAFVWHQRR